MRFFLIAALLTFFTGCGVSVSPLPGVSVYIPIPHNSDQYRRDDRDYNEHDGDRHDHDKNGSYQESD